MPVVRIPSVLRKHADGHAKVEVGGTTVREAVDELVAEHPALREQLLEAGGEIRGFVNVFVDDEDIRYLDGLDTSVADGDEIAIMPAVAGGSTAAVAPPSAAR